MTVPPTVPLPGRPPAFLPAETAPPGGPRPPACLPAGWVGRPPDGARVAVAGLVLVRQRPGTAKGVIFVTLEDETGVVNVIVWAKVFERFRRAVIAGRLLRVTGRIQRGTGVTHVVAETVEDISDLLDALLQAEGAQAPLRPDGVRAGDQPGTTRGSGRATGARGAGGASGERGAAGAEALPPVFAAAGAAAHPVGPSAVRDARRASGGSI